MRTFAAIAFGVLLAAPAARADEPPSQPAQPAPPAQPAAPAQPAPSAQPAPPQGPQPYQQHYPGYPPPPPRYPAQGAPPAGYGTYPGAPGPQYYPPPPPRSYDRLERRGLVLGFALGGGAVRFKDDGDNGFAFSFDLGGMLSNNLALMFDMSSLSHAVSYSADESHSIFGGVVRVFFLRFLWAQAGIGFGHLAVSDAWGYVSDSTDYSLAGILAAGAEVLQTTGGFSLDIQARVAGASYKGIGRAVNTSLLLGFNFY